MVYSQISITVQKLKRSESCTTLGFFSTGMDQVKLFSSLLFPPLPFLFLFPMCHFVEIISVERGVQLVQFGSDMHILAWVGQPNLIGSPTNTEHSGEGILKSV